MVGVGHSEPFGGEHAPDAAFQSHGLQSGPLLCRGAVGEHSGRHITRAEFGEGAVDILESGPGRFVAAQVASEDVVEAVVVTGGVAEQGQEITEPTTPLFGKADGPSTTSMPVRRASTAATSP